MLRMRTRALRIGALALVLVFAFGAVALASNSTPPALKGPKNGAHVHAGVVTFKVYDPGLTGDMAQVYITVSPKRHLDKYGFLTPARGCKSKCDFVQMRRWAHHKGWWIYKSPFNFPGYWAVTPGKYYWQANHVAPLCQAKGCELVSGIHSFTIVG